MIKNKQILIGITGGIAIYKMCSLVNILKKLGAIPRVVMTESATRFVTPLTFQSLTNSTVHVNIFDTIQKTDVEHIALAEWCNLFLLAPATYNTINKIATGIADNLLTTVISALPKSTPVLIAPAMNCHMWENKVIQDNINLLKKIKINKKNKYNFVGPAKGKLVCGYEGEGVLIDIDEIVKYIDRLV